MVKIKKIKKNKKAKIIEKQPPIDENVPLAASRISDEQAPKKVSVHNLKSEINNLIQKICFQSSPNNSLTSYHKISFNFSQNGQIVNVALYLQHVALIIVIVI